MHDLTITPTTLLAGLGVLLTVLVVWRSTVRRAKAAADAARASARLVSLTGRVLGTAGVLVGAQWLVVTHAGNQWLLLAVLAAPDVLAAHVLTRALTITTVDLRAVEGRSARRRTGRRGDGR